MAPEAEKRPREVFIRKVSRFTRFEGESELLGPKTEFSYEGYTLSQISRETKDYRLLISTEDGRKRTIQLAFGSVYQLDNWDLYFKATSARVGQSSKIRLDIGKLIQP